MKATDLRELTPKDLDGKLKDMKEELFNLRFAAATGQLDNYRRIREVRREIGRIMTIQAESESQQEPEVKKQKK